MNSHFILYRSQGTPPYFMLNTTWALVPIYLDETKNQLIKHEKGRHLSRPKPFISLTKILLGMNECIWLLIWYAWVYLSAHLVWMSVFGCSLGMNEYLSAHLVWMSVFVCPLGMNEFVFVWFWRFNKYPDNVPCLILYLILRTNYKHKISLGKQYSLL